MILTLFGLLVIFTSSSITAQQSYGDSFYFLKKQSLSACLGLLSVLIITAIPLKWIERCNLPLFFLTTAFLWLTLTDSLGHNVNGASRWLNLGLVTFQPVELAKLSLILFLSKNLTRPRAREPNEWRVLLIYSIPVFCFGTALMLQPDFGSTLLLAGIAFLLLFVRGLPFRYVASFGLVCIAAIALAIWQAPYRMARLMSFIDPWQSAHSGGFQIIQSYLGFYNGGLFGLGLGESRQKLYFLPEAHTDFILSVIGEELGFVGVIFVIAMFAYMTWLGFRITLLQKENFRKFFAFGLTSLIAIQASINMGVSMGLLPTKGMPLPFVSHGSSSLLVFLWVAALLAKLALEMDGHHDQRTVTTG
jgi:cell division protein FtsW